MVAILVPVLNRPQNVKPLLNSITDNTPQPHRVLFLADPGDHAEHDAIHAAGGDLLVTGGNYAHKIHAGIAATTEPLIFTGADDLRFQPGWLPAALAPIGNGLHVVGVNDLLERRPDRAGHATHFLMTRAYAQRPTIDDKPGPFFQGYTHSFVDDELIGTALRRGVYAYAENSHVQHLHVMNGLAPDDETYRLGRQRFRQDRRLFLRRRHLWT